MLYKDLDKSNPNFEYVTKYIVKLTNWLTTYPQNSPVKLVRIKLLPKANETIAIKHTYITAEIEIASTDFL